mmetsp:Transcript_22829/g.53365  ORF Transcript_22829/g.53365 Transcript_22829/m.53365 type:complete len:241 (-) Transcript_22829:196-918(-)
MASRWCPPPPGQALQAVRCPRWWRWWLPMLFAIGTSSLPQRFQEALCLSLATLGWRCWMLLALTTGPSWWTSRSTVAVEPQPPPTDQRLPPLLLPPELRRKANSVSRPRIHQRLIHQVTAWNSLEELSWTQVQMLGLPRRRLLRARVGKSVGRRTRAPRCCLCALPLPLPPPCSSCPSSLGCPRRCEALRPRSRCSSSCCSSPTRAAAWHLAPLPQLAQWPSLPRRPSASPACPPSSTSL